MKKLIVIAGPTAVGKTSIAIDLAKRLGCEIISCDSRQFYKELNIGTAKPTKEELNEVPHHFINSHSIKEEYTAFDFELDGLKQIKELHQSCEYVIMVGGSGLFVKAVCEGFDEIPDIDPKIREALNVEFKEKGLRLMLDELKERDPEYFEKVDQHNPKRIIRALEVIRGTGKPFSSFRKKNVKERPFDIIKIGLEMDREKLYQRIELRMDQMLKEGLLDEVKSLQDFKSLNALQTVGYSEIFRFLEGEYDWEECVRLLKRNSRRYAKRQLTWFKKDEDIQWFDAINLNVIEEIFSYVKQE